MANAVSSVIAPRFSSGWAQQLVEREFGMSARAIPLGGYDHQNFEIVAETGDQYILKLTADPDEASLDAQNRAMHHLASVGLGEGMRVPFPIATPGGNEIVRVIEDGRSVAVQLLSFVPGVQLRDIPYLSPGLTRELGRLAALIVAGLGSMEDPPDPVSPWDLRYATAGVAQALPLVAAERRRELAARVADDAQRQLTSLEGALRVGLIHCDLTVENVIAERMGYGGTRLTGVIDFADMCRSWLVAELVILATSCIAQDPRISTVAELLRGFHETLPLERDEVDAIMPLIALRAVMGAVETDRRAAIDPDNAHLAAAVPYEWRTLEVVAALSPIAPVALRHACGLDPRSAATSVKELIATEVPGSEGFTVVDGLSPQTPSIDLSVTTDELRFGEWDDRQAITTAIRRRAGDGAVLGRYGEPRIVHTPRAPADEPSTVHLGVDVFAPSGSLVRAAIGGRVESADARSVVLAHEGFFTHWRGISPDVEEGSGITAGDSLGSIAPDDESGPLPPHLHLQVCREPLASPPGLVLASLADPWRSVCPDPSPLLGVASAAVLESPELALRQRKRVIASPQAHYYSEPPEIVRGWRQWLYDSHARSYLDMVNNVAILGHSHPAVAEAAARQFRLLNTNSRFLYPSMTRFAEALLEVMPEPFEVVFLVNSGSEANDLALQLVRQATGAESIIALERAYHGWTGTPSGVSTHLEHNPDGRLGAGARTVPAPNTYRDRGTPDHVGAVRVAAAQLADGGGLAGFISEGFSGVSGGIPWPDGYLRDVYEVVRGAGGLCIADEVQAGYGRLGTYFWGFEQQGVMPDVVSIAKCTGNGHPVAAVVTTRAIADEFGMRGPWFSSVGGTPVSCEVGLAVLRVLRDERLQENARDVGGHLRSRLVRLVERHPICGAVHGMGLYLGLELVRDRTTLEPATEEALAVCERMRQLGVIVQPTGDYDNVLKIKPPLVIDRDDAEKVVERLDHVLAEG